jgi:hypothetical protein
MQMATGEQLREQARRFEQAARKLLEAADVLDGVVNRNGNLVSVKRPRTMLKVRKGTRADHLRTFLRQRGPSTRKEIIEATKFPLGTINYLLKEKRGFVRDTDGKWTIKAA